MVTGTNPIFRKMVAMKGFARKVPTGHLSDEKIDVKVM